MDAIDPYNPTKEANDSKINVKTNYVVVEHHLIKSLE